MGAIEEQPLRFQKFTSFRLQMSISFVFCAFPKNGIFIVTYCILETGSKQYRVSTGDKLEIERLAVEAGQPVTFDRILLVSNEGKLSVGSPTVQNASVVADVVGHIRGEKKLTFKLKRRKGYRKKIGHRQELTVVQIKEIKV
jgi:large subunit ribosomal protein L21